MKPQRTIVDVYVGDRRLGQAPALFKPGKLKFLKPQKVVDLLGIRKRSRKRIAIALNVWMPTNVAQICRKGQASAACGRLTPKVAGIIFDEASLRVRIFVNPKYLESEAAWRRKYLRRPRSGLSFLTQLDGAVAGQASARENAVDGNLRMLNLVAFRNFRLRLLSNTSVSAGTAVESLAGEWDWRGYAASAGLIRSTGSFLLPQVTIYGGHAGTSTDTRIDLDQAFGSQLSVFLPRQSIVEIIRDGRVLSARFYPSGNQLLDTRSLPSGAYPVTLRIRETGGRVREETRFFTKASEIPPADQPLVFAEGGVMARDRTTGLPTRTDRPFATFGARIRVRDNFVLGAQVAGTENEWAGEVNLFYLSRHFRISLSGVGTTRGDWGAGASISASWKGIGANLSGRYINAARDLNGIDPRDPDTFRFFGTSLVQVTGSLTYRLRKVDLTLTATMSDSPTTNIDWTISPSVRVPVWRRREHDLSFVASGAVGSREHQVFLKFVYRWTRPKISVTADAGARYEARDGSTDINDVVRVGAQYRLPDVAGHRNTVAAIASRENSRATVGASLRSRGPYGRYGVSALHNIGGDNTNTSYAANLSTGIAIDRNGIGAGGRERSESAVIVRIRGAEKSARFKVFVNGQQRALVNGAGSRPIFLQPYKTYRVSVTPARSKKTRAFANLDQGKREVVLYPGTVRTLVWRVRRIYAVFGRAMGRGGMPVRNAEIKGVVGVAETDGDGYFQAEVKSTTRRLRLVLGGRTCTIRVPRFRPKNGFATLGELVCRGAGGAPVQARGTKKREQGRDKAKRKSARSRKPSVRGKARRNPRAEARRRARRR